MTLFGKSTDQEDGRLMSQNNHVVMEGIHVLLWSRKKSNEELKSKGRIERERPREHTGHSKHSISTTQATTLHMDITRWSILKSD